MSEIVDLTAAERRMQGALDSVRREFSTIRTGRANPAILDRIEVVLHADSQRTARQCPYEA